MVGSDSNAARLLRNIITIHLRILYMCNMSLAHLLLFALFESQDSNRSLLIHENHMKDILRL
jgi:hypothetical protein